MKHPTPGECTSTMCRTLGCEYCQKCDYAIFTGRSKVNGRMYRWEYSPWRGLAFIKKDGEFVAVYPGRRNPVWAKYEAWRKRRGLK